MSQAATLSVPLDTDVTYEESQIRNWKREVKRLRKEIDRDDKQELHRMKRAKTMSGSAIGKAVGMGGAIGAAGGIIDTLFTKDLKNWDKEDWKDLGMNTLKGAGIGALGGLSSQVSSATPMVGSVANLAVGIVSILADSFSGNATLIQCLQRVFEGTAEMGLSIAGSVVGSLIPIPILGTVVGMVIGQALFKLFHFIKSKIMEPSPCRCFWTRLPRKRK